MPFIEIYTREVASAHANGAKGLSDYRMLMLESKTAGFRASLRTAPGNSTHRELVQFSETCHEKVETLVPKHVGRNSIAL